MNDLQWLMATPRSPLVFRSGRPFGAQGQSGAEGFDFPMPATVAGAVRAAWVDVKRPASIDHDAVRRIGVQGPFLLAAQDGGQAPNPVWTLMLPAPADAVDVGNYLLARAEPMSSSATRLPHGLLPVGLPGAADDAPIKPKPMPPFWRFEQLCHWLGGNSLGSIDRLGPVADLRVHVGLKVGRKVGDEGRLFQSRGLAFGPQPAPNSNGWSWRFALAARVQGDAARVVAGQVARMGADGRTVRYGPWPDGPALPAALKMQLGPVHQGLRFRLVLATPAVFAGGWYPDGLQRMSDGQLEGDIAGLGRVRLVGAALGRWQAHSGWRMERDAQGKARGAKPTRRVVPAGAVYWFEWVDTPPPDAWERLWLYSLCGDDQDRRDGWGLVMPGVAANLEDDLHE